MIEDTLELECGVTLELQSVNGMVLLDFVEDGPQNMTQAKFNRMIKYLAGWGVKNDVPEDKREELEFFGKGEHLQRAAWVRLITTENEIAQLMAQVMSLTHVRIRQPTPEQTELEQLRAKVKELEAEPEGQNGSD